VLDLWRDKPWLSPDSNINNCLRRSNDEHLAQKGNENFSGREVGGRAFPA
jgi:hypothetical protein